MLTLTKKVEYALIAVLHMGQHRESDLATAKDMAERYGMPQDLLGKVLQALARAGIVDSTPGVRGGYSLKRALDRVTLGDVIEAVEGPVFIARCQEDPASCGQFHACSMRQPIHAIQEKLIRFLHDLRLTQFVTAPKTLEKVS